ASRGAIFNPLAGLLRDDKKSTAVRITLSGIDPEREQKLRPLKVIRGRALSGLDEIVLEQFTATKLGVDVGDSISMTLGKPATSLKVVGIVQQPGLSAIFEKLGAFVTLPTIWNLTGQGEQISEIDIVLNKGVDAQAWAERNKARIADSPGLVLDVSAKITAGFQQNVRNNQVGFTLASVLAFLAAAFIITTGLTTSVTERTRELSVLRCIGGTRFQLAASQVFVGLLVGLVGGIIGVPLGAFGSWALVQIFQEQLPGGFALSGLGIVLGLGGSIMSGVIGGLWPAVAASRVSPLEGLSVRSRPITAKWFWLSLLIGLVLLGVHAIVVGATSNAGSTFWLYVFIGVPCLMAGYFMISVPVTRLVAHVGSGPISGMIGLPGRMLSGTLKATPYRHGYTAGAMMLGLALMVSIWTNGRAVLRDWLDQLEVPDAFAVGLFAYPEETLAKIRAVDGIKSATPISLLPVDLPANKAQGVQGLNKFQTSFIGFEPSDFFSMTALKWEMPTDAPGIERAKRRLGEGGAIIVSREFLVNRDIPLGGMIEITSGDKKAMFEVVGVVRSPGLDVVSKFYSVGEGMNDQAVNSVFGSREDLKKHFNFTAWNLIQMAFTDEVKARAEETPRATLTGAGKANAAGSTGASNVRATGAARGPDAVLKDVRSLLGLGILEIGSALEIKNKIREVISGTLLVASVVAIGAMVISCFAVANLIIAGIQARQFEFGVLRAVGAPRWLLGRLVIGEALVIGIAACVLGTAMGIQGAWGGQKLYQVTVGIVVQLRPPWVAIGAGCGAVLLITLLATLPAAMRLVGRPPRALLGAMKG
ncbi:MAG: FtsX-like permease family protein, partial [Phycisphaerales bacterium]|nr:FtsX-like permease family protein [Phycisphaerales bacterium]